MLVTLKMPSLNQLQEVCLQDLLLRSCLRNEKIDSLSSRLKNQNSTVI